MGLILNLLRLPTPRGLDHTNNSLAASVYMDMLNRDLLLTFAAVSIQRFEQGGIGSSLGPRRCCKQRQAPLL